MLRGEQVLVTGGAGFIGSSLVERLAPENTVSVLDDLSMGTLRNLETVRGNVHLIKASLLDRQAVLRATKGCTVVFHLAARTSVPESFREPQRYGDVNVLGTAHVLAGSLQAGVRRVVFASSCAVYGPSRRDRIPETARPNPKSPYAASKLAGEQLCGAAVGNRIEVVKLRVFNAFGPRQSTASGYASVIANFVAAVADGRPLKIYGSGNQTRDFVHVEDVADAFELAAVASGANGEVINVGTGQARSVLQVIAAFERIAGRGLPTVREPARPGDIARSCSDARKAKRVLGFESKVAFEEGLRSVLAAVGINGPR